MSDEAPHELWRMAHDEFPDDVAARRIRYIALMREHGHLVPTLDGRPRGRLFECEQSSSPAVSDLPEGTE